MAIYTFERYEKKFLLPVDKAERIEKRLAGERGARRHEEDAAEGSAHEFGPKIGI